MAHDPICPLHEVNDGAAGLASCSCAAIARARISERQRISSELRCAAGPTPRDDGAYADGWWHALAHAAARLERGERLAP